MKKKKRSSNNLENSLQDMHQNRDQNLILSDLCSRVGPILQKRSNGLHSHIFALGAHPKVSCQILDL